VKFVLFVDVLGFGAIFVLTYFIIHANKRVQVLGYICMVFALSVFVAPLGIIVSLFSYLLYKIFLLSTKS